MTTKKKIISTTAILCAITLALYGLTRIKLFEKDYSGRLVKAADGITGIFKESTKTKNDESSLASFLKLSLKKHQNIALLAISDKNSYIKIMNKNEKYIKTAFLYDSILNDFTEKKLAVQGEKDFLVRYYNSEAGKNEGNIRLYIFQKNIGDDRLLIVFPYEINERMYVRFALEVMLIILLFTMAGAAYYIISSKNRHNQETPHTNGNPKETKIIKNACAINEEAGSLNKKNENESIEQIIFALFKNIYKKHETSSIYLHLKNSSGLISRAFELKGKSFIKIDSGDYDILDSTNFLVELEQSTHIMLENGRKFSLPLNGQNGLFGVLTVSSSTEFSGPDISSITESAASVVPLIERHYGIPQNSTEAYHQSYFMNELKKAGDRKKQTGEEFSVAVISFAEMENGFKEGETRPLLDITTSAIKEKTGADTFIDTDGNMVRVIMKKYTGMKALDIIKIIENEISRFRIKLENGKTITLTPKSGISSSDTADNIMDMLKYAEADLERYISITKRNSK